MRGFINFVFYNVIVYVIYAVIDYFLTVVGAYSSPDLGESLSVPFTSMDLTLIIMNGLFSMIAGLIVLRKFKALQP